MATLTVAQCVAYAKGAGFTDAEAVTMGAVGMAESSGKTDAVNFLGCTGIWQIYVKVHQGKIKAKYPGEDPTTAMKDPAKNAVIARQIYVEAGNSFRPWEAYTKGMHLKYMGDAQKAAGVAGVTNGSADASAGSTGVNVTGGGNIAYLTSSQTWFRVLWAIAGIILVVVALSRMTGIGPSALPVGKVAKVVKAVK